MSLPRGVEPLGGSREGGGSGEVGGGRGGEGGNPSWGGLLGFPLVGGGSDFRVVAAWADGVKVAGDKFGDA